MYCLDPIVVSSNSIAVTINARSLYILIVSMTIFLLQYINFYLRRTQFQLSLRLSSARHAHKSNMRVPIYLCGVFGFLLPDFAVVSKRSATEK